MARRLFVALAVVAAAARPVSAQTGTTELLIYVGPNALGTTESSVERTKTGWQISGTGRLRAPLDLLTRQLTIQYDANWQPLELRIEATAHEEVLRIYTKFDGSSVKNEIVRGSEQSTKVHTVSPGTLVLPNLFFASYEALAIRLGSLEGDTATLPAYVAPQAEIPIDVRRLDHETIESGNVLIRARRFALTFRNPGKPLDAEMWVGDDGRLLRFAVPAQQLLIARSDLARVTIRLQSITRPGDQAVHIPANGFTLVGTLSEASGRPPANGRFPAVVLVPGSGTVDRDETVAGIPIFGQLAGDLADAGYAVLRYDKRGVGQSGGRSEAATLADYAEDLRMAVSFMARRKDIDSSRIAVFGHGEGTWVALLAASQEKRVKALVLAAGPSGSGADLVLEQQSSLLNTLDLSDAEKQSRMDLQRRIQAAVLGQGEWTDIPASVRQQADVPWFRSFLSFDPASTIQKVKQPLLIVQGQLDRQVPPHHAERLAELARARKKATADSVSVATLPAINHLLVQADTGDVAEYARLTGRRVSPEIAKTIVEWLNRTIP